jgi:hypothetical protein
MGKKNGSNPVHFHQTHENGSKFKRRLIGLCLVSNYGLESKKMNSLIATKPNNVEDYKWHGS